MDLKWSGIPVPASADSMRAQAAIDTMEANVIPRALAATEPADQEENVECPGGVGDAEIPDRFAAMVRIWFIRQLINHGTRKPGHFWPGWFELWSG